MAEAPALDADLSEFLFCLRRHGVRFVVAGGYVMATLGRPRYTDDLGVLVEPSANNAARVAEALRDFGGFEALARSVVDHLSEPERMISLGRPPLAIDLITSLSGLGFEEAWEGRQEIEIEGAPIPFLGLREFVLTKRAAGRTKDLLDLELLREAGLLEGLDLEP